MSIMLLTFFKVDAGKVLVEAGQQLAEAALTMAQEIVQEIAAEEAMTEEDDEDSEEVAENPEQDVKVVIIGDDKVGKVDALCGQRKITCLRPRCI